MATWLDWKISWTKKKKKKKNEGTLAFGSTEKRKRVGATARTDGIDDVVGSVSVSIFKHNHTAMLIEPYPYPCLIRFLLVQKINQSILIYSNGSRIRHCKSSPTVAESHTIHQISSEINRIVEWSFHKCPQNTLRMALRHLMNEGIAADETGAAARHPTAFPIFFLLLLVRR